MTWTCTAAAVATFFGGQAPVPGVVVDVPESRLAHYSRFDVYMAKRCARKQKIEYRIIKGQ